MSNKYVFKSFYVKESPFHKEYPNYKGHPTSKALRKKKKRWEMPNAKTFRLNPYIQDDLENHFKKLNMNWTEGMSLMIQDYLDRICLQRQTFNHLEVIMLIPKTDDIDELVNKSKVIAYINTKTDFNDYYIHNDGFEGEYNLVYELKPFDELRFPLNIIRETKESCVINTSKEDCDSFDRFKASQKELYSDFQDDEGNDCGLDLDDCYFVRFPLNNYIDSFKNGEYSHDSFKKDHMGLYVFHDPFVKINKGKDYERKILFVIDWHYLSDISKIEWNFAFGEREGVLNWINQYRDKNEDDYDKLIQALKYAYSDEYSQMKLSQVEESLLENLETVRSLQKGLSYFSND